MTDAPNTEDKYVTDALAKGRPEEPCECVCGCELHTYPDDDRCIWCQEGDHAE